MTDFECTPQVALDFMNREHRKAFDDANALKRLLDKALALKLDSALKSETKSPESEALGEFETEEEAKTSQSDSTKIELLMQTLLLDTVTHFKLEEQCMEQYEFPAREAHSQEHRLVLQWMDREHSLWSRDCNIETINHQPSEHLRSRQISQMVAQSYSHHGYGDGQLYSPPWRYFFLNTALFKHSSF
jgi:hypothetical protein